MSNFLNFTYLFFNTRNYTNSNSLSSYTLPNTPLTFIPDFNSSPLLSGFSVVSNKNLKWDFGDGTYSSDLTAVHWYKWPGKYKVKITLFDNTGKPFDSIYQPTVNIIDFIPEQLDFDAFRKFIYDVPASKIIDPIVIRRTGSWQSYKAVSANGGYTINLYASGAAGDFIDINSYYNDKWSHLRSLSRFYEIQQIGDFNEFVIVDEVKTKDNVVYARVINNDIEICSPADEGSVVAGTTGRAYVYYVDDKTKNYTTREPPILLLGTLDNSLFYDKFSINNDLLQFIGAPPKGYMFVNPAVFPIIKVRHNPGNVLSITTNGVDGEGKLSATNFNIPYISFQNTEIPFVIRIKDTENYTTKTYPSLSCSSADFNDFSLSRQPTAFNLDVDLVRVEGINQYRLSGLEIKSDFSADIPRDIGGFYKGTFKYPKDTLSVKLTAGMKVVDPVNFSKDSLVGWVAMPNYNFLKRIFKVVYVDSCKGTLDYYLSAYIDDFEVGASRNSLAVAVAPSGRGPGEDYCTWVADGSNDVIYKLNVYGNILSTFNLSSYPKIDGTKVNLIDPVLNSAAPNSIALDGNSDVWISLFDSVSVIKIDSNSGALKAVAYPTATNLYYHLSSDYTIPMLSGFAGENSILPSSIDTDGDNNLWVSYSLPASSFLIKYDTNGLIKKVVRFPFLYNPYTICVDRNKDVWVSVYNNTTTSRILSNRNDYIYKFNKNGILYSGFPLSGFKAPGDISVDGAQNAYVYHDKETVSKIFNPSNNITNFTAGSGVNTTNHICSIGGMACDTGDYVWVINNFDKKLYFLDTYSTAITTVSSNPNQRQVQDIELLFPAKYNAASMPVSAFEELSYQTYGDWIGSRWINKYMIPYTVIRTVTGETPTFNLYSDQGEYNLTKINEDFDAKDFYNSSRFQENLLDKNMFFDEFLGTIVGGFSAKPYELGKVVYEKISNFVSNNSDIDKCNLDKLLSFCEELNVQFEQYNYPFPPELRRLVDILSIKHKLLFGEKNKFNLNFNKRGTIKNSNYGINLGAELDVLKDYIIPGKPLVAKELFSGLYTLVNTNYIPGYSTTAIIPLSNFSYDWGWGLVAPLSLSGKEIRNYYKFYNYNKIEEGSFYGNIINWSDRNNTLKPYLSSFKDWASDKGVMENILSYELHRGLRLFTSAVNLIYNN